MLLVCVYYGAKIGRPDSLLLLICFVIVVGLVSSGDFVDFEISFDFVECYL